MISIIVSSINEAQNLAFRRNVEQTIGCDYELLIHDNRQTGWGLCKLYNHYAARSRYDILCFFHEDVLFHTNGWGAELVRFYDTNPQAGVVGFAGSTLKTQYTSGWGSYPTATRQHMIQRWPNGKIRRLDHNPNKEEYSPVVVLDGFALVATKKAWSEHPFDEELFQRFHLYDLDFTTQVAQHYTNYVCHTIDVEHQSVGSFNREWYLESEKFTNKWSSRLPLAVPDVSSKFIAKCQRFGHYKSIRLRLIHAWSDMSREEIVSQIGQVGIPYKLKTIRYVCRALIKRAKHS